jgi:hypothetical protein
MKTSPLLISFSIVTSLSLLNISSALSAVDQQEKPKAVQSAKAKTHKAKSHKAKTTAKKAVKPTPIKLASADTLKFAPVALTPLTTNPYLVSQPLAILPKAMNPYAVNPGITVPASTPSVESLPVAAVKPVVSATPVAPAPVAVAPVVSAVPTTPVQVAPVAAAPAVVAPVLPAPVAAANTTNAPAQTVAAPLAPVAAPMPVAVAPIATPMVAAPIANPGWNIAPFARNPYSTSQQPLTTQDAANLFNQFGNSVKNSLPAMPQLSSLTPPTYNFGNPATAKTTQASVAEGAFSFNQIFSGLKGLLPQSGDSVLPVIKTVYPTGEKPLVVINFKCPTEVIGISTPPMKLLHELLNYGFDGLNKTNLLSFNLQQVCS